MTFKDFIQHNLTLLKDHPEFGDLPVIYAEDEEGNAFHLVNNVPIPMTGTEDSNMVSVSDFINPYTEPDKINLANYICIN